MEKRVVIGGIAGAAVISVVSFGLLLLFNQPLTDMNVSTTNLVVTLIIFLLAPVGGGFLAGMIGKPNPHQAGLIAGSTAGILILAAFLLVFGLSFEILMTGMVVVFVWVILARIAAGFTKTGKTQNL